MYVQELNYPAMTSTATSYSRKLQREQMWQKLKNNSQKNNSAICQKTVDQQSKDKQKLAHRQPILLQGTVVGFITCIKLDVGIYKPLMHPLVQLTLHVYP